MIQYVDFHKQTHKILHPVYSNITEQLGVKGFGCLRVYKDDSYYLISNNLAYVEDYISTIDHSGVFYRKIIGREDYNGKIYKFILWPLEPANEPMKMMYKIGLWNGVSAIYYDDDYTEIWWAAGGIQDRHLLQIMTGADFHKNFLLSIDYFEKSLKLLVTFPEDLVLPKYNRSFADKLPLLDIENFKLEHSKDIARIISAYYKTSTMFKIGDQVVSLTKGETEVLSMIARGFNSHEIGEARGSSVKTVENQLSSIKLKTGISLRSELCKLYYDQFGALLK